MIKILTAGLFFLCTLGAQAAAPRLAVVIVVDQMRSDYLTRFSTDGGFARLARLGSTYSHARQAHVPTETAPGHATLLTGRYPREHGIVGNAWWDASRARRIGAVEGEHGASPELLLAPTLGDILKNAFPNSRVVSVSGKDRAAVLMGGRNPDLVAWYQKETGEFHASSWYRTEPDWLRAWNTQHAVENESRVAVSSSTRLDVLTLDLAMRAVVELHLGAHKTPDLLLVSLSATDIIGHAKGPYSPELESHLSALDKQLALFLDALDRKVGPGQTLLALSADHGCLPLPESPAGVLLGARRVLQTDFEERAETILRTRLGAPPAGRKWLAAFFAPNVYLSSGAALGTAAAALSELPEVALVRTRVDASAGPYGEELSRGTFAGRSGDLMLVFKSGFFIGGAAGTGHGSPYEYDAAIPLVLYGAGTPRGAWSRPVVAVDLAPTLAARLGLSLSPTQGSALLSEAIPASAPSSLRTNKRGERAAVRQ